MTTKPHVCVHCGKDPEKTDADLARERIAKQLGHYSGEIEIAHFREFEPSIFNAVLKVVMDNPRTIASLMGDEEAIQCAKDACLAY